MSGFIDLTETIDENLRKIFVGRLSGDTTNDSLKAHFSKFGELATGGLVTDKEGNSKKFGFITYATMEAADLCIQNKPHTVDGKAVDAKRAIPKDSMAGVMNAKKLFLGGLPKTVTVEQITELFNTCILNVKVSEVILVKNKENDELKGFGFVTFEDEDHVAKVAITHYFNINGKKVEAKGAQPKEADGGPMGGMRGGGRGGGRGGRGGGRGGYNNYGGWDQGYGAGYYDDYSSGYGNGYGNGYGQGGDYYGNYGGANYAGYGGASSGYGRGRGGRFNPY